MFVILSVYFFFKTQWLPADPAKTLRASASRDCPASLTNRKERRKMQIHAFCGAPL